MNIEQTRLLKRRARAHGALADETRLHVFDKLAFGDASASELGAALGVPSNLLAHHLNVLESAGLITRRRSEGDGRRSYLSRTPESARLLLDTAPSMMSLGLHPRRVLFVCTANTARSHLAAALWRQASPIRAASAGTHPGERINPAATAAAQRRGLRLPSVAPRVLETFRREGDVIVTVCDRAHEELGGLDRAHWSIPDPVPVDTEAAYDLVLSELERRVAVLAPRLQAGS
jgi:protein-tyrosine-phosphatase/DNA-binding HxlR family transcriptional regulator